MKNIPLSLVSIIIILMLLGCATTPPMITPIQHNNIISDTGFDNINQKPIAIGRVIYKNYLWFDAINTGASMIVVNDNNLTEFSYNIAGDGYFYLTLDPGDYYIRAIVIGRGVDGLLGFWNERDIARTYLRFTINDNEIVYIGSICVEKKHRVREVVKGLKLSGISTEAEIFNAYDNVANTFRNKYTQFYKSNILNRVPETRINDKIICD